MVVVVVTKTEVVTLAVILLMVLQVVVLMVVNKVVPRVGTKNVPTAVEIATVLLPGVSKVVSRTVVPLRVDKILIPQVDNNQVLTIDSRFFFFQNKIKKKTTTITTYNIHKQNKRSSKRIMLLKLIFGKQIAI